MRVVPVVVGADVLFAHVLFVGGGGGREPPLALGVVPYPVVDVAGHMDHVAGGGGQGGQQGGAGQGALGMSARFDGVDPVVIGGRVVGGVVKHGFENGNAFFLAGLGFAASS